MGREGTGIRVPCIHGNRVETGLQSHLGIQAWKLSKFKWRTPGHKPNNVMRLELEPESPGFQPRVLPLFYIKTEVLELLVSKSFNVMPLETAHACKASS